MIIRTITCHDVYNYGASLQAYALQHYLMSKGHDVKIIDYKPDYLRIHYNFWHIPSNSRYYNIAMKNPIVRFLLCCYFIPRKYSTYGRKLKFDNFKKKFLHLTHCYLSYDELREQPPKADLYIAGSDQIWNSNLPNGKDPAFFLQFGDKKTKRISYAASFAISQVDEKYKPSNSQWLKTFDAISVRENTGLSILKSLDVTGVEVLDPVYLLKRSEWLQFADDNCIVNSKYILVYDLFVNDERMRREAERISTMHGLTIISVDASIKCPYAHKNISNAGPQEFINLISHAELIITNSFHATSFSLILNKPFKVYYKYKNASRISDILSHVGLMECLNPEFSEFSFDWDDINSRLEIMREMSCQYLNTRLE